MQRSLSCKRFKTCVNVIFAAALFLWPLPSGAATFGPDVTSASYASASSTLYATYLPGGAFDDQLSVNPEDRWASTVTSGWLQQDFGAGNEKVIVKYTLDNDDGGEVPKDWVFEASNDRTNWTALDRQTNQNPSSKTEYVLSPANTTTYRYYRINVSSIVSGNVLSIREMEMMEKTGSSPPENSVGPDVTSPSFASASSTHLTYIAGGAFDDQLSVNPEDRWASAVKSGWLQQDFGADNEKVIVKYTLFNGGLTEVAKDWVFEASNDGANWTAMDRQTDQNPSSKTEYVFSNTTAYRYYRINVSSIVSGNVLSIWEMEMMEKTRLNAPEDSVTTSHIQDNAITSAKIKDGTIQLQDLDSSIPTKGDKGDPGIQGVAGADGAQGLQGPQGPAGQPLAFRGALVRQRGRQSVPKEQWHEISWNTEVEDIGGFFNPSSPTRFTIPAGVKRVRLTASVRWVGEAQDVGVRFIFIKKNGRIDVAGVPSTSANVLSQMSNRFAAYQTVQTFSSYPISVVQGDYLEVALWHNSEPNQNVKISANIVNPGDPESNHEYTWFGIEVVE